VDDHLQELLDDLGSKNGMVRKTARETLEQMGGPAAPRLRELLASPHKRVRWEALKTLGTIGDRGSLEQFVALLDDPDADLRWLAATGLIRLGSPSIKPVLQALTDPKRSRGRLEMSRRVLSELTPGDELLAEVVAPLLEVIDGNDRAVIAERAGRALSDMDLSVD
jgi:HEAT repeat protein